jgi:hypothetical protein
VFDVARGQLFADVQQLLFVCDDENDYVRIFREVWRETSREPSRMRELGMRNAVS